MSAARRRKHEEHENHERWLVSYADFITLLFAFFVVLYATSSANEDKQKKFEDSVRTEMKLGVGMGSGGMGGAAESLINEVFNPLEQFPKRGSPNEVRDYVERQVRRTMTKEEREKTIQEIKTDPMGARISLAASAFFPSGSAKLKRSALESLNKIADILKNSHRRIVIEGHTDDQPIQTTDFPSNWELASGRATSVIRYLIKYENLNPKRLAALSYADQHPVVENTSEENRERNRRIEILITGEEED